MNLTNETPEGWYWLITKAPDRPKPDRPEIVYVSGDTTYRRKPCRLVCGWSQWSERLDVLAASPNGYTYQVLPIEVPEV